MRLQASYESAITIVDKTRFIIDSELTELTDVVRSAEAQKVFGGPFGWKE